MDYQYSMFKYAAMHKNLINNNKDKKIFLRTVEVKNIIFKNSKNKFLITLNKYIFFPIYIFFISKDYKTAHIGDQGISYLVNFLNCKTIIVTCHDLILLKYRFQSIKDKILAFITKKSLEKANIIIAVSINTKKDVKKYIKTKAKIYQIYSPIIFKAKKNLNIKYKKFILHIGNHFYKNRSFAINFFRFLLKNTKVKYSLVCVGTIQPHEKKLLYDLNLNKNIFFLKNISETKIVNLYKKCEFLLVSSLYEGYGYPVLEAYHYKKKIIATSSGSLNEILINSYKSDKMAIKSFYRVYKSNLSKNETHLGTKILDKINNKIKYKIFYNKIYSQ